MPNSNLRISLLGSCNKDLAVDCCVDLEACCCVRIDIPGSGCSCGRWHSSESHQYEAQACAHCPMDEPNGCCSRAKWCGDVPLFVSAEAPLAWLCAADVELACTHPFDELDFAICHLHQPQSPCRIPSYSIDLPMQYLSLIHI